MLEVKDYQMDNAKADNQPRWQPTPEENELLSKLSGEMDIAIRHRSKYEDQWNENIERHEAKPFFNEDGSSGVVLPISKWIVESKQATEAKSPPSFSYEPGEYEEDKEVAKIMDQIVRKHVWNLKYVDMDYKLDIGNNIKDIVGGFYQYVGWRKIYRTIREKQADGTYTAKQELYYDDVCVDNIFPQDVWLHPLATCIADSPWIKIRKRMDYATFLETFSDTEMYKNVDKVQRGKWTAYKGDNATVAIHKDYMSDEKDQVVIFEHWNKMRDELVIIANGVIIYDGSNPYEDKELPFVDYLDRLQFNTYVGEAEPQRIATICDAINAFLNIAIDKEKRAAGGINLLDENMSDFDDVSSLFDPTVATRVSSPKDAFVHYDLPGMSSSTDRMISMLMDYLIFATGVDFRQITDMNASTQATVAAIRREITQGRLNLNVRRNENRGYKRLGWLLMKRVQQFYPLPLVDELTGGEITEMQGGEGQAPVNKPINYRSIRVKGLGVKEVPSGNGEFTKTSLRLKDTGNDAIGFFQARPAYIRTKGDLVVRVVAESTFAASRELEKANAKDYLQMTGVVVETDPATGQAKPVLSAKYGAKKYVESMGYDEDEAFGKEASNTNTAQKEAQDLMSGMGSMGATAEPTTSVTGTPPGEPPVTRLVGANSEPVQQLKADLGAANNITK